MFLNCKKLREEISVAIFDAVYLKIISEKRNLIDKQQLEKDTNLLICKEVTRVSLENIRVHIGCKELIHFPTPSRILEWLHGDDVIINTEQWKKLQNKLEIRFEDFLQMIMLFRINVDIDIRLQDDLIES